MTSLAITRKTGNGLSRLSGGLAVLVIVLVALFVAVWYAPPSKLFSGLTSYLPIHTFLETFAVSVAALIFGLGWHAYSADKPFNILLLSSIFLAVALLDIAHFLSYSGMPDFITPSNPQKAIDFWLAARLLAAMALLAMAVLPWKPVAIRGIKYILLASSLVATGLFYWLVLFHESVLPDTFVKGTGLTAFKIGFEYFLMALHIATALLLAAKLRIGQTFDVEGLLAAVCIMTLSELCFTLYTDVTDAFNLLGHVYKVIAYALLYKALFADSVKEPYRRLAEAQSNAWNEKERAQVTLSSIGDAVITTNVDGVVTDLNPVAAGLTGWNPADARGVELETVFNIVSEESGKPALNPARRAITEGIVVGLANHTELIARDGKRFAIEDSAAPIRDRDGRILGCVLVFHDVSDRRHLQKQLIWQARHDPLTDLPNRILLDERLQEMLSSARHDGTRLAVCFMDLDNFKQINDYFGHEVGDQLLVAAGKRLKSVIGEGNTVGRMGGDEFILLLKGDADKDAMTGMLNRILASMKEPFPIDEMEFRLTSSLGVALFPMDDTDADNLLRHADQAMYLAKQAGRNRFHIFDPEEDRLSRAKQGTVERIRLALKEEQFQLYYQPKVNMRTGEVVGVEALLRWMDPLKGMTPPGEFLPLIEQSDLIVEIGNWVAQTAFDQIEAWGKQGLDISVSINVAARQLQREDFLEQLDKCIQDHPGVPATRLELEILESAALEDIEHVRQVMVSAGNRGLRFALDDFGTGYSSLAYLKQLPAQMLKIDQTFMRNVLDDHDDLALIEGVIRLADTFNRSVIAEGVETPEQGLLLMRLGCDLAQGYGIARPMPAGEVASWVKHYQPDPQWALWANLPWEMQDFPLMVAQYDHLRWTKQIIDTIDGLSLHLGDEELFDFHRCRFGQWYDSEGRRRYARFPEFARIEEIHKQLHEIGSRIVRLTREGHREEARSLVPELLERSESILVMLATLQEVVARTYHDVMGKVNALKNP